MAVDFVDTANQDITYNDGGDLDGLTGLSLALWFRVDSNSTFYMLAGRWYYNFAGFLPSGWCIQHHDALGLRAEIAYNGTNNTDDLNEGGVSINADEWHHACLTWATSYRALYLDGTEVDNDANARVSITDKANDNLIYLAAEDRSTGIWNYLDGALADVGIWTTAISADQVKSLAGGVSPLRIEADTLAVYVPLLNTSYINDLSGAGYTGTVANGPLSTVDQPWIAPIFGFGMGWQGAFTTPAGPVRIPRHPAHYNELFVY